MKKHDIEIFGTWHTILQCRSVSDYKKKKKAIEKTMAKYNAQTEEVDFGSVTDYENEKDWKKYLDIKE